MDRSALILPVLLLPVGASAQVTAITEVSVIDVRSGETQPGMSVVVSGDRIVTVGRAETVVAPDGATVVTSTMRRRVSCCHHDAAGLARRVAVDDVAPPQPFGAHVARGRGGDGEGPTGRRGG